MRTAETLPTIVDVLFGGGIFALAALALWIFCIIDVATTDESEMRNLPKMVWLLLVVFLMDIGSIAWLIAGRPHGKSFAIASDTAAPRANVAPPDASSTIVHEREEAARLRMWEEQLRRREEEVRRREAEGGE
jgi:hypothetical protein